MPKEHSGEGSRRREFQAAPPREQNRGIPLAQESSGPQRRGDHPILTSVRDIAGNGKLQAGLIGATAGTLLGATGATSAFEDIGIGLGSAIAVYGVSAAVRRGANRLMQPIRRNRS